MGKIHREQVLEKRRYRAGLKGEITPCIVQKEGSEKKEEILREEKTSNLSRRSTVKNLLKTIVSLPYGRDLNIARKSRNHGSHSFQKGTTRKKAIQKKSPYQAGMREKSKKTLHLGESLHRREGLSDEKRKKKSGRGRAEIEGEVPQRVKRL